MQDMLDYLIKYADTILEHYIDPYHGTPLFFDGCDTFTGKPVTWKNTDGSIWEPSNIASQQNLFRFFSGLSAITHQPKYKQAAKDAIHWHFEHADSSGLIRWGGHSFLDLKTLNAVGPENKNMVHELKHHCPYYELMYETNPTATSRMIMAIWNCHVTNWENMEMSRHGSYGLAFDETTFWDKPQSSNLEPLREMKGLSFVNIGNDLVFSAGMLYKFDGDEKALSWAEFLMRQYVDSRHPETKLGCYQYNRPKQTGSPPEDESHPQYTFSFWGDRAARQFGAEYGDVAKEAWVLFKMDDEALNGPEGIYGDCALAQTLLARELGEDGKQLLDWTTEGLEAWAQYAYDAETNEIKPMFADGKDLTGHRVPRYGYYGKKGVEMIRRPLPSHVFLTYVTNWVESRSDTLWSTVCAMAKHVDLGEWNTANPTVKLNTEANDALLMFAVLEMHQVSQHASYLELAEKLGNNIMKRSAHRGLFTPSEKHIHCRFDDIEPLALLSLTAAKRGQRELVPVYRSRGGYIHGDMMMPDGSLKNTMDVKSIYLRTKHSYTQSRKTSFDS
ncbi:pectate lyase [Marinomonas profundimaris]|uniref:Pectate lyase n=1 Tax=Marinomonas profundimaris TaxID=1208321 RepID=W1RWR4_9GAMM|nr:pectate lyase [Marinomonas profundimaris]ETI61661.1 pectate lyase [Marinomonas profundimaris]